MRTPSAVALALALGPLAACGPPAAARTAQTFPVKATNLAVSPGVTLVQACTPSGPELCFNAVDDNCNGVIDEGCGEPTGLLQFAIAWAEPTVNVDLTLLTPANEKVPGERSRSTASGFHAGPDCPEDESCRGQNKEYVFFDGLEPPKGHYTVDIALAKPHEGDGILDGPVKVRFGARLGARVVGFDVELSPGQDVGKTFSFDVP